MLIDGKLIANQFLEDTKKQILDLGSQRPPCLAFILVGNNPASELYVKLKVKRCKEVGIETKGFHFEANVTQAKILEVIDELNKDPTIDGILVQMPLPPTLVVQQIVEAISPLKDVDGFHPLNIGRLHLGYTPYFIPCTPLGIHQLLLRSQVQIAHKHIVIMGRSNIVGKPLASILMQKNNQANATVSLVHSHTHNIEEMTLSADILVAAMGSPKFVGAHMVKKSAVVIDVGINRLDGKLVGDVDFKEVEPVCSQITPVPGGVGPMTIAMLLANTLRGYQMHKQLT